MADQRLKGKVALVTGSARGLGRAIIERLAELGAAVAVHDINSTACAEFGEAKDIDEVAAKIGRFGSKTTSVCGNIADEGEVIGLVSKIERDLGPIDILVNCAGGDIAKRGGKPKPNNALGIPMEDVQAIFDRNFIGTVLLCKHIVPGMQKRRRGSVINIGSAAGHVAVNDGVAYACAKAAILHFTKCLALDVRNDNVRVNAVSPGATVTARFLATRATDASMTSDSDSLTRYGQPREIADAVAFLASDEAHYISGHTLLVDGGATLPINVGNPAPVTTTPAPTPGK